MLYNEMSNKSCLYYSVNVNTVFHFKEKLQVE